VRQLAVSVVVAMAVAYFWAGGVTLGSQGTAHPNPPAFHPMTVAAPMDALQAQAAPAHPTAAAARHGAGAVAPVTVVISRLGVHAPVYDRGVNADGTLIIAPGYALTHLQYSARLGQRGNYVVYGHDDIEGSILRYEDMLRVGDRIDLYQGAMHYVYQIVAQSYVDPGNTSVMDQTSSPMLTLISCWPYNVDTQRVVVVASLVELDRNGGVGAPGSS